MAGRDKEPVPCRHIALLHLPSLGTATVTYQTPSISFDEAHAVSLSPDWSRWTPEVRGRLSTKAAGARGRGEGLTFQRRLSRFVYRTLSFAFLPLVKGRRAKTPPIERGGKKGGYSIYLQALGVCLWRSLGLSERSWGGAVFGCLDARWECCLSLFDVPGPFSLMPSLPSGLFALQRD